MTAVVAAQLRPAAPLERMAHRVADDHDHRAEHERSDEIAGEGQSRERDDRGREADQHPQRR